MAIEIAKGRPLVWQDVVDLINMYYPVYSSYLTALHPTEQGAPLFPNSEPGFPDSLTSKVIGIAMLCPPHTSERPDNIGGMDLIFPDNGLESSIQSTRPLFAADTFAEFESAVYTDISDAIGEMNQQYDDYVAANPDVFILMRMTSEYTDEAFLNMATLRIAGRQL